MRMFSVLRRPTLTRPRLMKAIQQNHKSAIYSKPPKERIGPMVGLNIFYQQMCCGGGMDRHPMLFDCIKMYHNSRDSSNVFTCFNWLLNYIQSNCKDHVGTQTVQATTKSVVGSQYHCIATNVRNSSELSSPACRVEEMFYSFLIHKSVLWPL